MDLDTEETREIHNLYIKSIHIHGSLKNSKKNFHQEKLILKVLQNRFDRIPTWQKYVKSALVFFSYCHLQMCTTYEHRLPDNILCRGYSHRASIPRSPARRDRIRESRYADKHRRTRTHPQAVGSDPAPSCKGDLRRWGWSYRVVDVHPRISLLSVKIREWTAMYHSHVIRFYNILYILAYSSTLLMLSFY